MYPLTFLEWWWHGEWCRIGWDASTPESAARLREHGEALSKYGGRYRLVTASLNLGDPGTVIHEYLESAAATGDGR